MEERLQKILARAGYGSRRVCDQLVSAGRVTVNGRIATPGTKADPHKDLIQLDGNSLKTDEEMVYIVLNKPRGVLSTVSAPDQRQKVVDLVESAARLFPVGRLDVDSEGLILLTNDGELANQLTHPRYEHEKEYRVLVARKPDDEQLNVWRRGVVLTDGYRTLPAEVQLDRTAGRGAWLKVILREGRKRQIREMGTQTGLPVVKIIRIRIGGIHLGSLKPGQWRFLTKDEINLLKQKPPTKKSRGTAKK
jgi:23S rRNA pseudouridine2605 synthase